LQKKSFLKLFVSLSFTCALAAFLLILSNSKAYQALELKSFDLRFILRGNKAPEAPVLHIDIDDASIEKLGRWPWPRVYHAKLVETLAECGAKYVLMDVLFTEKLSDNPQEDALFADSISRSKITYLPFYFIEDIALPSPELKALLEKDITLSAQDAAGIFKTGIDSLKSTLPAAKKYVMDEAAAELLAQDAEISIDELLASLEDKKNWFLFSAEEGYFRENLERYRIERLFAGKFALPLRHQKAPAVRAYEALNVPIREYIDSIKGSGFLNAEPDQDGLMRKVPLFIRYKEKLFPQLSVSALLDYLEVEDIEIKNNFITLKNSAIAGKRKDIRIPVDDNGSMLINWAGRWEETFSHAPYHFIIKLYDTQEQLRQQLNAAQASGVSGEEEGKIRYLKNAEQELREKLKNLAGGKICIVGLTATGTQDMGPIPFQNNYPFVGVHSNLINTILSEGFLKKSSTGLNIFIFFFTALIISLASLAKLWKSLLLSVFYAIGYFLVAFFAFVKFGLWIDLVGPTGIVVFGFSAITSFRYFTEEKEKLWIKQAFSHYLSKEVINELMDDPSKLKLGGERRNITVIFSDVRGFTSFSEARQPEEVVAMLNSLLSEQVKVVFKYSGTLDKFVGDELMAFFGAPGIQHADNHAEVAVRTAVEIQSKMKELQQQWSAEKKESLNIGIGINSGDMVVGNMGSAERMDYTVIGDNVNLGARLCSVAKGGEIIISEATYEACRGQILAEKLESISVKGKAAPVSIYRVIAMK